MKTQVRMAVLLLGVMFLAPGSHLGQPVAASARLEALASQPSQPASVTVPGAAPVVVEDPASLNTRGWNRGAAAAPASTSDIGRAVLAAYSLAAASAPAGCHLPISLLAAIGQVESGNLAGRTLDADHRVVPAALGPVLDGSRFAAVPDTDAGQWDGDTVWDRALGPMQLIPASWRAASVDMDGDGRRDPQDIDDAAGAAMVYLCAGGRDLATAAELTDAVLSYNHSSDYLRTVLAWKAAYDRADLSLTRSLPTLDARALPSLAMATLPDAPTPSATTPEADPAPSARPSTHGSTATPRSTPAGPTASPGTSPATTPATTPSITEPTSSGPASSVPPETSASPDPTPDPQPDHTPDPTPTPTLLICLVPDPTQPIDPTLVPDPEIAAVDAEGKACIPLVDPVTREPVVGEGVVVTVEDGTVSSQTRSDDPGTP